MSTMSETLAPTFTYADRCDRCGAQAYLRAWFGKSDLLFCGHHARQHHAMLALAADDIEAG